MEQFRKYPNDLFEAKIVHNKYGRSLELDPTIKQVYLYMLLKYEFYNENKNVFFENQDEIAIRCAVSRHTVLRTIKKLKDVGLISVVQKRLKNGALSNSYMVSRVNGKDWWYDDKKVVQKPQLVVQQNQFDDDPDCPF